MFILKFILFICLIILLALFVEFLSYLTCKYITKIFDKNITPTFICISRIITYSTLSYIFYKFSNIVNNYLAEKLNFMSEAILEVLIIYFIVTIIHSFINMYKNH